MPTRFMLVAATNPCPCGYAGDPSRCRCGEADHARHARKLSGPLLDRIDIVVNVHRPSAAELQRGPITDSATEQGLVQDARERQQLRLWGSGSVCNGEMDARLLREHVQLDPAGRGALERYYESGAVTARGRDRVLKVARTMADLDGESAVHARHVHAAMSLRDMADALQVAA
jgi:magnesium chelatase family protein